MILAEVLLPPYYTGRLTHMQHVWLLLDKASYLHMQLLLRLTVQLLFTT